MRLACVSIPRFPLAVELHARRRTVTSASTIVYLKNHVLDASPELAGAWPGRALRQARALYPHATYTPADTARYAEAWAAVLRALASISPEVEPAGEGAAYLSLTGLERLYIEVEGTAPDTDALIARAVIAAVHADTGLAPTVGVAEGKFPAYAAACTPDADGARVIPHGRERAFLRNMSVDLLPFEPEIAQRLHALAIHTLGDIAALPRPAVEAQFRSLGGVMWDLARGLDPDPLRPHHIPEAVTERLAFESPVVTTEALVMAARQVVRRLSLRLSHRAARKMHAQILAEGRIAWERIETFRDATADEARMMTLLKSRLDALQLGEAVDTVVITLSQLTREPGRQGKLITETNPQLERLLESIHQIRARFGRPMVWRAVEVDPCSRHPEDRPS